MLVDNLLYFDIETTSQYEDIDSLKINDERGYFLFKKKYENNLWMHENNSSMEESYINFAPIFSSYGKIVCISCGYFSSEIHNDNSYKLTSYYGDDEKEILIKFQKLLTNVSNKCMILCGFKVKSFDIPWITHKLFKYNIDIPKVIDTIGKKPWEISVIDLSDEWKGQFKHNFSLDEVSYELGIKSPKDELDGSEVYRTYWKERDINKIKTYCEKDVLATMRIADKILKNKL